MDLVAIDEWSINSKLSGSHIATSDLKASQWCLMGWLHLYCSSHPCSRWLQHVPSIVLGTWPLAVSRVGHYMPIFLAILLYYTIPLRTINERFSNIIKRNLPWSFKISTALTITNHGCTVSVPWWFVPVVGIANHDPPIAGPRPADTPSSSALIKDKSGKPACLGKMLFGQRDVAVDCLIFVGCWMFAVVCRCLSLFAIVCRCCWRFVGCGCFFVLLLNCCFHKPSNMWGKAWKDL